MTTIKHFSDTQTEVIEISSIQPMKNAEFQARFPGVKGRRYDGFSMIVGTVTGQPGVFYPITRSIEYKKNPSLHACNAKCMGGKCNGVCECRCGGKNHGRSNFS